MLIAFRECSRYGVYDRAISWWTHSSYVHCELLFDNGRAFSSEPHVGTRFTDIDVLFRKGVWRTLVLPISSRTESRIFDWCLTESGCGYDWPGILFSQILRLRRSHPDKWFCSEVCACALLVGGLRLEHLPCEYAPGSLYNAIRAYGATSFA